MDGGDPPDPPHGFAPVLGRKFARPTRRRWPSSRALIATVRDGTDRPSGLLSHFPVGLGHRPVSRQEARS